MSAQKRKRQTISIELKKRILDGKEKTPNKSYNDLAKEFSTDKINLTD
jgi:hypothetical protein